jgi:uncharacterized protein (DUF433 family)
MFSALRGTTSLRKHAGVEQKPPTPDSRSWKPRILGNRIKVKHVAIWHEQMGMTPA